MDTARDLYQSPLYANTGLRGDRGRFERRGGRDRGRPMMPCRNISARPWIVPTSSEFIGFAEFNGGNLYSSDLSGVLQSEPFQRVTRRKVEAIVPCRGWAIRHFCGAPCPAEIKAVSGSMDAPSPYCEFYEVQVRYAFRVIAKGREDAYLWDGWEEETEETFCWM
jgi:uncharacterized protein